MITHKIAHLQYAALVLFLVLVALLMQSMSRGRADSTFASGIGSTSHEAMIAQAESDPANVFFPRSYLLGPTN